MDEEKKSVRERAADLYTRRVFTRADLVGIGIRGRDITRAVRRGSMLRLRRDRYALPTTADDIAEAVRVGGRLSCVSVLTLIGVFVHVCAGLHVHVPPGTSRTRSPRSEDTTVHWSSWSGESGPLHVAPLIDVVTQAVRCQAPRAAIATLDSVLNHGLMTWDEVSSIFVALPARYMPLLALVDATAGSGPETFMRLILRGLGVPYETQVFLPGVGYVDFVVAGWLIIECDSKEFHEGWKKQVDDRRRDLAAARLGYVTIRPLAADIMREDSTVRQAVSDVIEALGPRFA
ncbi:MAG: hypothetical protein WAK00_07510 [Microbacterium sp.]